MSQIVKSKDEDTRHPDCSCHSFWNSGYRRAAYSLASARFQRCSIWALGRTRGVHDVGQVVATAQIAGPTALAFALVIKLTRGARPLAPMVAATSFALRIREGASVAGSKRPPIMPLFVAGFIGAMMVRTFLPVRCCDHRCRRNHADGAFGDGAFRRLVRRSSSFHFCAPDGVPFWSR